MGHDMEFALPPSRRCPVPGAAPPSDGEHPSRAPVVTVVIPDARRAALAGTDTLPPSGRPRRPAWRPFLIALHAAATLAALVACAELAHRAGRDRDVPSLAAAIAAWFVTVASGVLLGAWFGLIGGTGVDPVEV